MTLDPNEVSPRDRNIPLNAAYREINALGGIFDATDKMAVALDAQLGIILEILEKHGAWE